MAQSIKFSGTVFSSNSRYRIPYASKEFHQPCSVLYKPVLYHSFPISFSSKTHLLNINNLTIKQAIPLRTCAFVPLDIVLFPYLVILSPQLTHVPHCPPVAVAVAVHPYCRGHLGDVDAGWQWIPPRSCLQWCQEKNVLGINKSLPCSNFRRPF